MIILLPLDRCIKYHQYSLSVQNSSFEFFDSLEREKGSSVELKMEKSGFHRMRGGGPAQIDMKSDARMKGND